MRKLALGAAVLSSAALAAPQGDWTNYGRDPGGMRFSPLTQITPANVGNLKRAWTYQMRPPGVRMEVGTGFGGGSPRQAQGAAPEAAEATVSATPKRRFIQSEVTPIVADGLMFISTPYGRVVALDADTGKEVWNYAAQAPTRGVAYWRGDSRHAPRVVFTTADGGLVALDAKTGKGAPGFGVDGVLAGKARRGSNNSPPSIYRDIIISGYANPNGSGRDGDIRAFDVLTGRELWRFATVPPKGAEGYDSWAIGSAERQREIHVWGLITVDDKRGMVFVPTDAPDWDRYGGDRHGANLYGTSLVALDARTGRKLWHFQLVHHDIWDGDNSAPPALFDIHRDGRTIPAVATIGKMGILFLLDRRTGKPIYGVEERPVSVSEVPGELASPTQPFPLKPEPLARVAMSADEVATVTPELERYCRALIKDNNIGLGGPYNPPGWKRPTLNFPGALGSANYGGVSYNPKLGLLFVNTHDLGQLTGIDVRGSPRKVIGVAGAGPGINPQIQYDMAGLLGRFKEPVSNMMCQQPPWGSLYAVNVNTGEIAWRVNLGETDSLPEGKRNTGRPNLGGTIATASGLVFVGATDDSRFRAFDARTGKLLWTADLPAPNHSVPVTYTGHKGKQYVVFPATGGSFLQDPAAADDLIAYSLP
ncbi:MAG: PQQ-binding-like beta-propeller repeat protein [Sphingomicrobium sp.]